MSINRTLSKYAFLVGTLALASAACANGVIDSVEAKKVGSGLEVIVIGTDLGLPKLEKASKGATLVYSFNATMKARAETVSLGHADVRTVQWTQFTTRPRVARVVLRVNPGVEPRVTRTDRGVVITVGVDVPSGALSQPIVVLEQPKPIGLPMVTSNGSSGSTGSRATVVTPSSTNTVTKTDVIEDDVEREVASQRVAAKRISLDFVDTEIVQILKALAAQGGVNIVTSPDVKQKISLSLRDVTVDQALNVVTAIAGLRFQRVDQTIVVAPADRISSIIYNASVGSPKIAADTEVRIVPIYSKQGKQLRSALYRVMPQESGQGRYEVVLPSEQMVNEAAASAPVAPANAAAGADVDAVKAPASKPSSGAVDEYVMVVGTRSRLEEVARMVRTLDEQICVAVGIDAPSSSALISETYFVRGAKAEELVKAMGADRGMIGNVQVIATPTNSSSRQTIVLLGRENEVKRLMNSLQELDGSDRAQDEFLVYDVKFSDPRALRDEIMIQMPGVRASIPPAGVGATRVYQPKSASTVAKAGEEASATSNSPATDAAVEKSTGLQPGLSLPFSGLEQTSVPMKLILRGSQDDLERAVRMMDELDKEPRQVAIELRVMELRKEDAVNTGIDWNLLTGGAVKFIRLNNSLTDTSNGIGVGINDKNVSGDVVATLDKIANKNNLVARPNMVAYDGRESELFIGDVIRYVETVTSSQNGPSVQIGEVRVGVNLAVLPRVSGSELVTLDLRPTVSFLREFRQYALNGFNAELPQTSERVAQQTVTVRSGETIAIGGLLTTEEVKTMSGIPILMDLPILGQFFRSTRTRQDRRELVFFITTRTINDPLGASDRLPMQDKSEEKPAAEAKEKK